MGISASSLLDETKANYIKDRAEAELKEFSPYYRKQFSVARFSQVEDDLEQHKEQITQLLIQKEAPEEAEVLYEEGVFYFDDTRKWRERYVVVRANYSLECHDSLESFVKGVPPRQKLLPTGGAVLTTEEKYMSMVDKCFPDDTNVKEDFAPPLSGMPGQFPVYLRLPYRRDSYFCFRQQAKQEAFLSMLSDCIRHQNQDFLKKTTCEVQAFLKAIQLYRQDRDQFEAWDMLIGSDVRVMGNLVMEQLLPSLEKDMLPRLKAKKTEKKRVWFATLEAAYILVQEHLLEGLSELKEACRASARQQEVLIHSDMDQIVESRRQLEEKVRAKVSEPAEKLCSERVQPYLASVLEELMQPISSGFQEGRQLSQSLMDQVCQDILPQGNDEQLKRALADMARPNLLSCYQKIGTLQDKVQQLQDRFGFSNITGVIHSAQIDLQQLIENAAYTFKQLLYKAIQDNPENAGSAIEKAELRVLKQYDYDSSTVRKRISQEALVAITLPFIKKNLAPICKTELQGLDQFIDADHSNFIHIENVYESILLQTLDKEVTKVVKEAASLQKYNLFTDSRDLLSQSSHSSLSSPSVSTPSSPAMTLASPTKTSLQLQPPPPPVLHSLSSTAQEKANGELQSEASTGVAVIETPLGKAEPKETTRSAAVGQEVPTLKAENVVHTVTAEADTPAALQTAALAESTNQSAKQEVKIKAAPETVIQEEVISVQTEQAAADVEPQLHGADVESIQTDAEAPEPSPDSTDEVVNTSAEGTDPQTAAGSEDKTHCESSDIKSEAPSAGQTPELTPADTSLDLKPEEAAETVSVSDPNSLDVSVGSESAPSDVESMEEVKDTQSSEEEMSTTSDVVEDKANLTKSPVSSDDPAEHSTASDEPAPRVQTKAVGEDGGVGGDIEAGASVEPSEEVAAASQSPVPAGEETPSSPEAQPLDSVKEIRDLVVEVIEVEELVQRYPDGVPKEE
uniref:protein Niban 1a isoform X2 n=1 Tax=Scatophagus argus TaxID=75038 RepID=UPI001ED863B3|nr:protein Niban 1a isoform X2 [Scatophagus argus]